jgi:hypothetical protein
LSCSLLSESIILLLRGGGLGGERKLRISAWPLVGDRVGLLEPPPGMMSCQVQNYCVFVTRLYYDGEEFFGSVVVAVLRPCAW